MTGIDSSASESISVSEFLRASTSSSGSVHQTISAIQNWLEVNTREFVKLHISSERNSAIHHYQLQVTLPVAGNTGTPQLSQSTRKGRLYKIFDNAMPGKGDHKTQDKNPQEDILEHIAELSSEKSDI